MSEISLNDLTRDDMRDDLMFRVHRKACVCETLRSIYDIVHLLPDNELKLEITERLIDAFTMAKKMAVRLAYYKETYSDDTGSGATSLSFLPDVEGLRKTRDARRDAFYRNSGM